ncbi:hypothetical protein A5733_20880 [Mycobacterium sp. NS-7484]|uniref:phage tail fiber protein n=1 Tax=Mycobacterium sp. NS-7484 TaxID=1834161 RepID=UPI00096FD96C|nr:hypothetical protein [Mycobacterium sp. NS-7484]OMC04906.1 hypothetical protein A5733_20880 [Mycobacterium sp. NS-7484]
MALHDDTHKAICDAIVARGDWVGVFTADPGTSGANEASGSEYGREEAAFPTGGMVSGYWVRTAPAVEVGLPSGTYTHGGLLSAASGGNFVGAEPFAGGSVTVTGTGASITITPSVKG